MKVHPLAPPNDYEVADAEVFLAWTPVPNAISYRLTWKERTSPDARAQRDGNVSIRLPYFTFDLELTPGARYEWQVSALSHGNRVIGHSEFHTFFADETATEAFANQAQRQDLGGYLGVMIQETALPVPGIRISQVVPNSPADRAGLQNGDVMTEFGGVDLSDLALPSFIAIARSKSPGSSVNLQYSRGYQNPTTLETNIQLGVRPDFQ